MNEQALTETEQQPSESDNNEMLVVKFREFMSKKSDTYPFAHQLDDYEQDLELTGELDRMTTDSRRLVLESLWRTEIRDPGLTGVLIELAERTCTDPRSYLDAYAPEGWTGVPNYTYLRDVISSSILRHLEEGRLEDLRGYLYIEMDINALKGINDVFGHDVGNILIGRSSEVLDSFGMPFCIKGGDEMACFWNEGGDDPGDVSDQILQRFMGADSSAITDLEGEPEWKAAQILERLPSDIDLRENRYVLSTSIGVVSLGEAIDAIEIKPADTMEVVIGKILTTLTKMADERAIQSKPGIKNLVEENPLMKFLLSMR